jgi:hypothetical protein
VVEDLDSEESSNLVIQGSRFEVQGLLRENLTLCSAMWLAGAKDLGFVFQY